MKTDSNLAARSAEVKETRAEKAIRLLTTNAAGPFDQRLDAFRQFYPAVAMAMSNGMKARPILKILAEGGLKLYPALFAKLMVAMQEETEAPRCRHCRQAIPHPNFDPTPETAVTIDVEAT